MSPCQTAQKKVMAFAVVMALFVSGCSQTSSLLKFKDKVATPTASDPLNEVLGIWQASDGRGPEGKPRRGCAGQLLFMTRGQKSPVKVDGEVIIREWDEFSSPDKPIHTFRFDTASWNQHYVEGALGPGYSVFIPYMRDNAYEVHCVVQAELKMANGQSIFSPKSTVVLPGPRRPETTTKSHSITKAKATQPVKSMGESLATFDKHGKLKPVESKADRIQQASYEESADATAGLDAKKAKLMAEFKKEIAGLKRDASKKKAVTATPAAGSTRPRPKRLRMSAARTSASRATEDE